MSSSVCNKLKIWQVQQFTSSSGGIFAVSQRQVKVFGTKNAQKLLCPFKYNKSGLTGFCGIQFLK